MRRQNTTSNNVSREKYDITKHKGTQWYNECNILKEKIDKLTEINNILIEQNDELVEKLKQLKDTSDDNMINDEMESENKLLRKDIRNFKKEKKLTEDNIIQLERDLFVKDSKIQRLEDGKKDLNERYAELKEDWREERRSNRKDK
jgi:chromosome segregation ATPase